MVLVNHSNEISLVELKLSATVEPPCTTTSRKPPLPLTDQLSKTPKLLVKALQFERLVNDHLLFPHSTHSSCTWSRKIEYTMLAYMTLANTQTILFEI